MAEEAQDSAQQAQFTIEKIYLKDLSLEVPNSPQVFLERDAPKVDIQLGTRATALEEGHYEVVLTVTATAKLGDKTVFLVEAQQAGIFPVEGEGDQPTSGHQELHLRRVARRYERYELDRPGFELKRAQRI